MVSFDGKPAPAAGKLARWEGFGVFGVVGRAGLEARRLITNRIPRNNKKEKGRAGRFVENGKTEGRGKILCPRDQRWGGYKRMPISIFQESFMWVAIINSDFQKLHVALSQCNK